MSIKNSYEFLSLVLDSITEHIVVIDETGAIQFVNKSWLVFGNNNACVIGDSWNGVNYIEEYDKASAMGDEYGAQAGAGIRSVIENRKPFFYFEYPCHSPDEKRWFMMRTTPFQSACRNYFVISHQNITERKLAEEEVQNLARTDGLTGLSNRRAFDELLHGEWGRCFRLKTSLCLAMVDLDYFKLLNDDYGHQAGDECLIAVGKLLKEFAKRSSDICARYGGDEFVFVWGDSSLEQAKHQAEVLLQHIADLNVQNRNSFPNNYVTASIGLAEILPNLENAERDLIGKADRMLYKAKVSGRNRVES